jgi:Fur family transcriptional regulator, zinc uptake regulator
LTDRVQGRNAAYVFEALMHSDRPLSAYDIIEAVRPRVALAPTTVYRALRQLISDGKAHRIESLNAFVACQHGHGAEPVHRQGEGLGFVICDRCGSVDEFIDPVIGERVAATLVERGFSASAVTLEVRGVCATCSDRPVAR